MDTNDDQLNVATQDNTAEAEQVKENAEAMPSETVLEAPASEASGESKPVATQENALETKEINSEAGAGEPLESIDASKTAGGLPNEANTGNLNNEEVSKDLAAAAADAIPTLEPAHNIPLKPESAPSLVREERVVVKEVARELNDQEKEKIYQDKLKEKISRVRAFKTDKKSQKLQQVFDFIKSKGALVSNWEIRAALKMPESTVSYRLKQLMARGLVIRVGAGRSVRYRPAAANQ